jgi:hypothetical protein
MNGFEKEFQADLRKEYLVAIDLTVEIEGAKEGLQ